MPEFLTSQYIVPLGGLVVAIVWIAFTTWRKVREHELAQESEMRQKEMEHQIKMKEMDLDMTRQKEPKSDKV